MVNDIKFTRVKKKKIQRLGSIAHVSFNKDERGRLSNVPGRKGLMNIDDMRRETLRSSANLYNERNVSTAKAVGRVISHESMHEALKKVGGRVTTALDNANGRELKAGWYNHPKTSTLYKRLLDV